MIDADPVKCVRCGKDAEVSTDVGPMCREHADERAEEVR